MATIDGLRPTPPSLAAAPAVRTTSKEQKSGPKKLSSHATPWLIIQVLMGGLLMFDAGAMFIHYIRISANDQIGHIYKLTTGVAILVSLWACFIYGVRGGLANLFYAALLLQAMCASLTNNYLIDQHYLGHVYYWLIMFAGYNLGRNAGINLASCERLFVRCSQVVLGGSTAGFLLLESYRSDAGGVYNGYSGDQLLFPLAVFVHKRMWLHAAATFGVLLLSSRRGPLAAALFVLVFIALAKRVRRLWVAALGSGIPLLLVGWLFVVTVHWVVDSDFISPDSALARVASKWELFFQFQDNLEAATSERNVEIEGAWALLWETDSVWWTGQGFGWVVEATGWHFVHLSYMNILVTHGLLLGTVLIGFIFFRLNAIHRVAVLDAPESRVLWILLTYMAAVLILSLTAAWLAISFLFWLALGLSSRLEEQILMRQHQARSLTPRRQRLTADPTPATV